MARPESPGEAVHYAVHRRIRRRVAARVAAKLRDGRLWRCVECDYDLRAPETRCPGCGAAVWREPPAAAPGEATRRS